MGRSRFTFIPRLERAEDRLLMSVAHVDTCVPVADPLAYPYNAVVNIDALFPNGIWVAATGR